MAAVFKSPKIILKETLNIPKSTPTNAINRLEKRKYFYRVIGEKDRRSFRLVLTAEGRAAQKEHLEFEDVICKTVLHALPTDKERETSLALVGKIADYLTRL